MLLNENNKKNLKNLLIRSQRIIDQERRGFSEAISVDTSRIDFITGTSEETFAERLINLLLTQNNKKSLCRICEELEKVFKETEGDFAKNLTTIKAELKCDSNIISDSDRETLLNTVQDTKVKPFIKPEKLISPNEPSKKVIPLGLENLPTGTKVIDIFDNEMNDKRTLLILGEPGSGKTTILADLTDELIERARKDKKHPIPIILNLSSWKEKQTIDEWSVEQLKELYQVPKEKGWNLVQQKQLLLLIDGFDELKSEYQGACVNALNKFINQNSKIVICSRTNDKDNKNEEKEKLLQELTSQIAVRLKSFELEEAVQYLTDNSVPDWLKKLVNTNNKLQILIKVPLFLYLIIEVYKSDNNSQQKTDFLQEDSEDEIWNKIFYKYIEKQLEKWKSNQNHSEKVNKEEVNRYLKWLAKQMNKEGQTEFLIEKMQPKWLSQAPNPTSQESNQLTIQEKIYRIVVRLIVGLLCGLASGLFSEILNYNPLPNLQIPWLEYISSGVISGLLSGLIFGLMIFLPKLDNLISKLEPARRRFALLKFGMIGLASGLIRWGVNLLLEEGKTQPLDAIIFGLVSGFIFYRLKSPEIETVDKMEFSIIKFIKNLIGAGIISLFVGTIMLYIGTLSKLNYDSGRLLITFPMQEFLEKVFTTPWFNNFLEKAVDKLIINYEQNNNISVQQSGFLAFILFIVINLLTWITLEWIKHKPGVTTKISIKKTTLAALIIEYIVIIVIFDLILKSTFSRNQDINYFYFNFFNGLNVFWGLLTLELYVGLLVGISLGFKKANEIEKVTKPNHGIIRTRNNALQAFVISGACSFVVSVVFWLIYCCHQDLIWWIYYKPGNIYNAISFGLVVGLKLALLSALINGGNSGLVCIKHFVLRVVLWAYKKIPCNYARFLEDATEQGFLIQTGGSFRFKHLMLLEHIIKHEKKESEL